MSKVPEILTPWVGSAFAANNIITWLREHPQHLKRATSFDYDDELSEWFLGLLGDSDDRFRFTAIGASLDELKRKIDGDLGLVDWFVVASVVSGKK
ncbi:hypothetical protein ABT282_07085 [Streptomyces sp. NPDC000927]|uniref:hypothetical protein n=1 Tax=Streptomyces sp. NPDC000927 TaxID=3154371 RepID=UPI003323251C